MGELSPKDIDEVDLEEPPPRTNKAPNPTLKKTILTLRLLLLLLLSG
jgi:hypothetical protein